ncbi:MAG: hypothetical protein GX801_09855, partial [Fibrobacter sp.]|nr:hypothetical protein [Fibrobacter sp.]
DKSIDLGLYTQVQQVDKKFLNLWYNEDEQNLFKAGNAGFSLLYYDDNWESYADKILLKTQRDKNDWTNFLSFLENISEPAGNCSELFTYINEENLAWYFAITNVIGNFDSYLGSGRNYYLYQLGEKGINHIIPWDLNLAWGTYSNNWNVYNHSIFNYLEERPLFNKVLDCANIRKLYVQNIETLLNEDLNPTVIEAKIDSLANLVRPEIAKDENSLFSLEDFETNLQDKLQTSTGSIPGLKEFITQRSDFIRSELEAYDHEDFVSILNFSNRYFNRNFRQGKMGKIVHNHKIFNVLGQSIE